MPLFLVQGASGGESWTERSRLARREGLRGVRVAPADTAPRNQPRGSPTAGQQHNRASWPARKVS